MAVISKGQTFATGEQVTALKLNNLADNATFASGAVDNVSTQLSGGAIIVKDGGVATAKLNDNAVTTAKIADANVTTAKIADANVTTAKIADANVTFAKLTDVIDDDTMATATATTLATSESIKAYVDNNLDITISNPSQSGGVSTKDEQGSVDINGFITKIGRVSHNSSVVSYTFTSAFPTAIIGVQATACSDLASADGRNNIEIYNISTTGFTAKGARGDTSNLAVGSFIFTAYGY